MCLLYLESKILLTSVIFMGEKKNNLGKKNLENFEITLFILVLYILDRQIARRSLCGRMQPWLPKGSKSNTKVGFEAMHSDWQTH